MATPAVLLGMGAAAASASPAAGTSGTTLSQTVTGSATQDLTYGWTLNKSVTPDTLNLFQGDTGTAHYTISVTKDQGTAAGKAVIKGQVTITNGGAVATQGLDSTLTLTMPPSTTVIASQDLFGPGYVPGTIVLQPGETESYPYSFTLSTFTMGASYKVTAATTITNHSGNQAGPTTSWSGPLTWNKINDQVVVTDSNGGSWAFSASGSQFYDQAFTKDGTYTNTASMSGTNGPLGQPVSATVTVHVYALQVSKTADTSLTRTYVWSVGDSSGQLSVKIPGGTGTGQQTYTVPVTVTSTDSNWGVSGAITIHNPAPMAATITALTDVIPGATVTLTDPPPFPYTLASGADLVVHYIAALPDGSAGTNTATVTLQNTPAGTTDFTGSADFNFDNATVTKVDATATITNHASVAGTDTGNGNSADSTINGSINTDP